MAPAEGAGRIWADVQSRIGSALDKSHVGEGLGIECLIGAYFTYGDTASGYLEFEGRRVTEAEADEILDRTIVEEAKRLLRDTEPGAPPNGGPATQIRNSGATEGPPSVS